MQIVSLGRQFGFRVFSLYVDRFICYESEMGIKKKILGYKKYLFHCYISLHPVL